MKEMIVLDSSNMNILTDNLGRIKGYPKIYQVPETWEELKELCKDIKVDLKLTRDGKIYCYEHLIAQNRTPSQMWMIIMGLLGE